MNHSPGEIEPRNHYRHISKAERIYIWQALRSRGHVACFYDKEFKSLNEESQDRFSFCLTCACSKARNAHNACNIKHESDLTLQKTKDQLKQTQIGSSTKYYMQEFLGQPKTTIPPDSSDHVSKTWVYTHANDSSDPQTGKPPVGMTSMPMSRDHSRNNQIHMTFNTEGVVTAMNGRRKP